jgi:hypothetical protein
MPLVAVAELAMLLRVLPSVDVSVGHRIPYEDVQPQLVVALRLIPPDLRRCAHISPRNDRLCDAPILDAL